ncbi:MAG: hypothetical protein HGA90_04455 [Alphaproteobacteria bacterium]|nr:hypothetical protein [Alphaproteobacteria bacterium]
MSDFEEKQKQTDRETKADIIFSLLQAWHEVAFLPLCRVVQSKGESLERVVAKKPFYLGGVIAPLAGVFVVETGTKASDILFRGEVKKRVGAITPEVWAVRCAKNAWGIEEECKILPQMASYLSDHGVSCESLLGNNDTNKPHHLIFKLNEVSLKATQVGLRRLWNKHIRPRKLEEIEEFIGDSENSELRGLVAALCEPLVQRDPFGGRIATQKQLQGATKSFLDEFWKQAEDLLGTHPSRKLVLNGLRGLKKPANEMGSFSPTGS